MDLFDTNVWVAIANENDALHAQALRALSRATRPILLPEYVLVETGNVLTYRAGKAFANQFFVTAINNSEIELLYAGKETLHHAIRFFQSAPHVGLSFVDTFLLYLSITHNVVTFDKQLEKHIRKQNSRVT